MLAHDFAWSKNDKKSSKSFKVVFFIMRARGSHGNTRIFFAFRSDSQFLELFAPGEFASNSY